MLKNNNKQANGDEAKAKPKVIKLGLDLHVRQVTECEQLDGSTPQAGAEMGSFELFWIKSKAEARQEYKSIAVMRLEPVATGITGS